MQLSLVKNLPFELLVGLRYTRAGRRSGRNSFISFISLISMAGIALGVAALIIVLSVMNGFQKEVRDRMLSVLPHIEILGSEEVMANWQKVAAEASQDKEVTGTAPYVASQALLTTADGSLRPAIVRGIMPELEPKVSDVISQVKAGSFADLKAGEFNIALGSDLARALGVGIGDKVRLMTQGQMTPAGMNPTIKPFKVVAIFQAGHFQYDSTFAFVQLEDAEKVFRQLTPTGLRLRVKDMQRAQEVAQDLQQYVKGDVLIRDWSHEDRIWFAAVKTEKRMMFIIMILISAVATFNLVSTLVMTVTDKQADIAILRTLGASPASIMKIFVVQGSIVGLLGTLMGAGTGILVALNIDVIIPFLEHVFNVQFINKEVYLIPYLPSDLHWDDVFLFSACSLGLSLLATLYPSWSAARVKPADALRYE